MHRASRYRLYPNQTQERQFARLCGAGRFVYNELLADQIRDYGRFEAGEIERPGASEFDFGKRYTRLKAEEGNEWLRELSATVVRGTGAFPLGAAFAHFSRRRREGKCGKQAGFPRFKARGRSRESFTITEAVKIQKKRLWVPMVGWTRMNRKASSRTRGTDPWDGGEARAAGVYRELDKWYVSVLWEIPDPDWHWHGGVCGVDRNSENLAEAWSGRRQLIPVPYERIAKYEARARHYQWRASRRALIELKDDGGEPVCTKSGKPIKEASKRRRRLQQRAAKAKRKAGGDPEGLQPSGLGGPGAAVRAYRAGRSGRAGDAALGAGDEGKAGAVREGEGGAEPEDGAVLLHGDGGAFSSVQGDGPHQGAGAEHQPDLRAVRAHRKGQSKDAGALPMPGLRAHRQRGRECREEHLESGLGKALGRRRSGDGTGRGQRSGGILHGVPG